VTATGTVADHRLAVKPTEVAHFALALAARLGVAGAAVPETFSHDEERVRWVDAVAEDLEAHRGRGLVLAGDEADAEVHTLLHAVNAAQILDVPAAEVPGALLVAVGDHAAALEAAYRFGTGT